MIRHATMAVALFAVLGDGSDCRAQELTVRERWATKGSSDVLEFANISGMAEAPDRSIWVVDGQNEVVVRVAGDGVLTSIIGHPGDGPGEFQCPTHMARTFGDEMAVLDICRGTIELFDASGTFQRRIRLESRVDNPKGFAATPNGDFVLTGGQAMNTQAIHRFGSDGKRKVSWFPIPAPRVEPRNRRSQGNARQVAGGPVSILDDGTILYSNAAPHHIIRFAPGDTVGVTVARDRELLADIVDEFEVERIRNGQRIIAPRWFFSQSRGVFALPGGAVLNIVTFEDEDRTLWELYDGSGSLISRVDVDRSYWPWNMTRDGDVLASYRDPDTDEHVATRLAVSY